MSAHQGVFGEWLAANEISPSLYESLSVYWQEKLLKEWEEGVIRPWPNTRAQLKTQRKRNQFV